MPPLVLALIDSVLALAVHHHQRALARFDPDHESVTVRAQVSGPELDEPGGLLLCLSVTMVPRSEEREVVEHQLHLHVDLQGQRILARDLALAELPLDRSGLARIIGELEAWCYAHIPLGEGTG